jgi:hypothetical protein
LLSLGEHVNEITRLLSIYSSQRLVFCPQTNEGAKGMSDVLSVVNKVMAVPVWPARPVLPIRWM